VIALDTFDDRDLNDLALLTLGPTLQGGRNNVIGRAAADQVFTSIQSLVRISANVGGDRIPVVAIEIKGGGDASNAHNRAGEAEKSQIKARQVGYQHRWLVMVLGNVPPDTLQKETPSTTQLFDAPHIMMKTGPDWGRFRDHLSTLLGATFSNGRQ
jgi:hypothetical protein